MLRRLVKRLIARQTAPAPPSRAQDVPAWEAPHEARASTDDIFYCFRLLLDRSPNMEEWAGHSSRAGEPLGDVVQTYVNSAEFNARRLLEAKMPEGVVCRHNGKFQVFADSNDPLIGVAALNGAYEPPVANVIETLLKPGDHFLDVGANLGYFSLLAASIVGPEGHVYSVEPNDFNVKLLESSRKANGFDNISVMQVGATDRIETLFLHAAVGNGSTTVLEGGEIFSLRTVPGIPLDNLLARRAKPLRLIKIDVEGYEYKALMGARTLLREDRPHIAFEFAAANVEGTTGEAFLHWLEGMGYAFVRISEGRQLTEQQSIAEIMSEYREARVDHIDVLAKPGQA